MQFSFSTLYMAIIASNVLLILLTFCFRSKKIMINAGYKLLSFFLICTLLRFLLPFELPFTKTVSLPEWISSLITWVRHPLFHIGEWKFRLWTLLLFIWFLGFGVKLVKYIRLQQQTRYTILSHSLNATDKEPFKHLIQQICTERKRKNVFQVFTVSGMDTPRLYGIFKPCILIPETLELSEKDWYYVLAHEASHHFHKDLLIKLLIRIVDMIYWWNPFCRILVRQTDTILEMRIDDKITTSDHETIKSYLSCLIQVREHAEALLTLSANVTIPFFSADDDIIEKRFTMLTASSKHKNHAVNVALLLVVVSINLLSYAFILEAYYISPEDNESTMNVTEDSFYAILRDDNTYDIYYNGFFLENTDSLEYHTGIQVYTEKEYEHEAH